MGKVAETVEYEVAVPRNERSVVLEVTELERVFPIIKGALIRKRVGEQRAVDGISFDIREGECLALVGESGSGKTTTLLEIMQLRKPQKGSIKINGKDTSTLTRADRAKMRSDVTVVFQDPMAALDPRMPIGDILKEPMQVEGYSKSRMNERVDWLLTTVGTSPQHASRVVRHNSPVASGRCVGVARALRVRSKAHRFGRADQCLKTSPFKAVCWPCSPICRNPIGHQLFLSVCNNLSVVRHISDRIRGDEIRQARNEVGDTASVFDNTSARIQRRAAGRSADPRSGQGSISPQHRNRRRGVLRCR